MGRQEEDREDLLVEATALVERAAFRLADEPEPVIVGFRRDGSASVFFGGEPVYQFNTRGQLRRAYDHGLLYKAEHANLISLRRRRVSGEVQLLRTELSADERSQFLGEAARRLTEFRVALQSGRFTLMGQVPESGDVARRALDWLDTLELPPVVAVSPRVGK